ncbi:glycosyltransferase family 39 protein [Patescibacteria group bacterium]|nr:glycosyltransferase family 39 protein [Patescibacteria group bacterium]
MNAKQMPPQIPRTFLNKFNSDYGILLIFVLFLLSTFGFFLDTSFDNQSVNYLYISSWSIYDIVFKNYGDQLPAWFFLAKIYTSIFGTSEVVLKLFPAITLLISAYFLFKLSKIYKVNGYLVTILFLFNPLILKDTAYIFKHWSFLILLSLSALYFFEKLKDTGNKKYILLLSLVIISGIYTNLVFLIFLSALIGYLVISVMLKQIRLKHFSIITAVTALSSIPLYFYYEKAKSQLMVTQGSHMEFGVSQRGIDFLKLSFGEITGINYLHNYTVLSVILIASILLLIVFKIISCKRNIKDNIRTIWLIFTVIFILLVLMLMASHTPVRLRYINVAVPLFYLAILPKSKKILITIIGTILISITLFSSVQMAKDHNPDDWKGVSSIIAPTLKKDTQVLLLYGSYVNPHMMEYYLGAPTKLMVKPSGSKLLSALYGDDIWIIARRTEHDAVYSLTDTYTIEEFDQFNGIKLIHLVKKMDSDKKPLIFDISRVEVQTDNKTETFEFLNGSMFANCCKENWQIVRIDKIESGGESKTCLFTHPRNNANINVIYEDVDLKKQITFNTGIDDKGVQGDLSPVYMDIFINDQFTKRIIQPDKRGWITTEVDTEDYDGETAEIKLKVSAEHSEKRHFCFDAEIVDKKVSNDYFYRNIQDAIATTGNNRCDIFQTEPIWPHNEKEPPYLDSKIFERWDCEEDLIEKGKIWHTVGRSFAISDGEYKEAIWMHPVAGKLKSLRYDDINLYIDTITGYYGMSDHAVDKNINATLTFRVKINGEDSFEDTFELNKGWKYFEIPVKGIVDGVTFEITTTNDRWNHFFFNSYLKN